MLLAINTKTHFAERRRTDKLQTFGLDERGLQDILYKSLDRLFPEDELILLMQSRRWQEEPDLMAIDKDGKLYIFELKAWESKSENLLQALRYGQLYGTAKYSDLDEMYRRVANTAQPLKSAHAAKFEFELREKDFNHKQVLVVMTNGLDYRSREAIQYWRSAGLDVRPWVYRVYSGQVDEMLLEIAAFRVGDNPYEDLSDTYYILNTNVRNDEQDHNDMLNNGKAAAYFHPWKLKIERLRKGDVVFLYQSGVGIVAVGEADGKLQKDAYHGNPEHADEEYFMKLRHFQRLTPPLKAAGIKEITGIDHRFMSTMFGLDVDSGKALRQHIHQYSAV